MSTNDSGDAIQSFSTQRAADIVGITYRQMDYWARTGLLTPSLASAEGSGSRRAYSYTDLLELKVIKRLIDTGMDLKKVRIVFDYVRTELHQDISSASLVIDGTRSAVVRTHDELIDALQRGQGVLPLSGLQGEVNAAIVELRETYAAANQPEALVEGEEGWFDEEGEGEGLAVSGWR